MTYFKIQCLHKQYLCAKFCSNYQRKKIRSLKIIDLNPEDIFILDIFFFYTALNIVCKILCLSMTSKNECSESHQYLTNFQFCN